MRGLREGFLRGGADPVRVATLAVVETEGRLAPVVEPAEGKLNLIPKPLGGRRRHGKVALERRGLRRGQGLV